MTRRGVLDPTRTDRSVRSVAILDINSGENVDALLLVYPNDDASVVARCRAMKGLILALRGATRSLSGRDATCATRWITKSIHRKTAMHMNEAPAAFDASVVVFVLCFQRDVCTS